MPTGTRKKGVSLSQLDASTRFYSGESDDGIIEIAYTDKQGLVYGLTGTHEESVSRSAILAQALTEKCAELGHGKVFNVSGPDEAKRVRVAVPTAMTYELLALPDLIYTPYRWTDASKAAWFSKPVYERFESLQAWVSGDVSMRTPVLAISFCYDKSTLATAALDARAQGAVTFLQSPTATYLGYTKAMVASGELRKIGMRTQGALLEDEVRIAYEVKWQQLQAFKRLNGLDIVQSLQQMFLDAQRGHKPDTLVFFDKIYQTMLDIHRRYPRDENIRGEGDGDDAEDGAQLDNGDDADDGGNKRASMTVPQPPSIQGAAALGNTRGTRSSARQSQGLSGLGGSRLGPSTYTVLEDFTGDTRSDLTVRQGEVLELLEKSMGRNDTWRMKNPLTGLEGWVPEDILLPN